MDDWEPAELRPLPYLPTVMDADLFPDDVAAWAVSVDPGSAVMTPLAVLNRRRMSRDGLLDALAALDRHVAWGQALQVHYLAELAQQPAVPTPLGEADKDWVREEVACALRLSFPHAANHLQVATELTGRLPDTLDLQERGQITTHHSRLPGRGDHGPGCRSSRPRWRRRCWSRRRIRPWPGSGAA